MKRSLLFKRSALALAIAMAAGGIQAQSNSQGYIFGQASGSGTVKIENLGTGFSREAAVDADGNYRIPALPTGKYRVTFNGQSREVTVSLGGTQVSFSDATSLDVVEVSGDQVAPIDVSSTESTMIMTSEEIERLPIGRDVSSVALLAPGTVKSDERLGLRGNSPSFGGASAAENAYYINGFNVTNILTGLDYNEVPFEALAEQQTKTGGYGAEFGRSMGGVTNVITKRGSNEWAFGGNAFWAPDELRGTRYRPNQVGTNPDGSGIWELVENGDNYQDALTYNLYGSGPIIQDRLFFYALYQGTKNENGTFGSTSSTNARITQSATQGRESVSDAPQGLLKVDWNVSDNHIVELTAFRDRITADRTVTTLAAPYESDGRTVIGTDQLELGGDTYIAKWTGYLTDTFTLSALVGQGEYKRELFPTNADCPVVDDLRATATQTRYGCAVSGGLQKPGSGDTRDAFRIDGEWVLGDHLVRFGLDNEKITSVDGTVSSGGLSYEVNDVDPTNPIAGVTFPAGVTQYVVTREFANGGSFNTENKAWYIEDQWQLSDNWLVSGGIRNESFDNRNADNIVFARKDNTWAPRFGVAWDVNGDATFKVYGNAGRYYIPIMANTNVRLSGAELDIQTYYAFGGTFGTDRFQLPVLGQQIQRVVQSSGVAGDPRSVVVSDLSPLFQDEYILGAQHQFGDWALGLRGIHRKMSSGMDDYCAYQVPRNWAAANGFASDPNDIVDGVVTSAADAVGEAFSHCILINPGSDVNTFIDTNGDGTVEAISIAAADLKLPKPNRTYNALEFLFERPFDGQWSLQGSYTWAHSYGNSEGYVKSDNGQDDSGITSDFDFAEFTRGAYGNLPNDRRHSLKVFGTYQINDEFRVGGTLITQSGRPVNCFGNFDYASNPDLPVDQGIYSNVSFYCGARGFTPRASLGNLPWTTTASVQLNYMPKWAEGLSLTLDVLNLFDAHKVTAINEALTPNVNYGRPTFIRGANGTQAPRTVRFSVGYDF